MNTGAYRRTDFGGCPLLKAPNVLRELVRHVPAGAIDDESGVRIHGNIPGLNELR
jgi:hypothetical protein